MTTDADRVLWGPPRVAVLRFSPDQTAYATRRLAELCTGRTAEARAYRRVRSRHHGPSGALLARWCGRPEDGVAESVGNILLNTGATKLTRLLTGTSPNGNPLSGTPASGFGYVGVGDGNTAAAVSQTALQGTNKCYNAIDAGFPTLSVGVITVQSTFAAAAAAGGTWLGWLEWGLGTSTAAVAAATTSTNAQPATGTYDALINRTVPAGGLGSKGTSAAWVFTVTLSVS
jgi:hypothetical protein